MVEAMNRIQSVLERNTNFQNYENDRDSQMIVERGFEIVSEASRHLPAELKQRHPEIPWKKVANIGNFLRHEYQRVTQSALWDTATKDIPILMQVCKIELDRETSQKLL